ncbi:MAG: pyrroloquinoline quinone biosynthesis protein PqqB [Ktedonobacteraceae bacterium]|nr:pyrroloquinoline quinone biosynthesis protein PqqB [Ktedonobacteraceae bacterium]
MWMRVLGSAAGGGFPQWNCNCPNCRAVRDGSLPCSPRTQSSIAVSADYRHWFLFNASPDIRSQINAAPPLCPEGGVRHTPIQGIVLSDAEMDHTLGLLSLRETRSQHIYATGWVHHALTHLNPLLRTLSTYCSVEWCPMRLHVPTALRNMDGEDSGLLCQAFTTLSSKVVAYAAEPTVHPESVVGYRITDKRTSRTLVYMPAVQELNESVLGQLDDCTCLLIDGTCWSDDELASLGIAQKTARSMGHLPIGGKDGSLEQLVVLPIERIIYIHINNTNPILIENSLQRHAVEERSLAVAFDGMELEI